MKKYIVWSLVSAGIGAVVGMMESVFKIMVNQANGYRTQFMPYIFLLIPFAGALIILIQSYLKDKNGMDVVFDAEKNGDSPLSLKSAFFVIISCLISHFCGVSTGRAGVSMQMGAALSKRLCNRLNIVDHVIPMGVAAAFSGLFCCPITSAVFACEVFEAKRFRYKAFIPCLISSSIAALCAALFGFHKASFVFQYDFVIETKNIMKLVALSFCLALIGKAFAFCLNGLKKLVNEKLPNKMNRILLLGSVLMIFMLLTQGRYSGSGENLIQVVFSNGDVLKGDILFKFGLTLLTAAAGFYGGEVTPLFSIGALSGYALGHILGLPVFFCAALGYGTVFMSAANVYLAGMVLIVEVFGFNFLMPCLIIGIIGYISNHTISIYPLRFKKENA